MLCFIGFNEATVFIYRNVFRAYTQLSSSVRRVFSSVHAVINLAIREQGLFINNVFIGTFIPDDEAKTSGFSRFGLGSVADEATGRFGDLKLRENYVFVFCVFG